MYPCALDTCVFVEKRTFRKDKLGINKHIEFVSVHRFGKRGKRGFRPILIKFVKHKDKILALKNCYKLKDTNIFIREQFTKDIEAKRKELYPVLKEAKKQMKRAVLIRDKLYINGELYNQSKQQIKPPRTLDLSTTPRNEQSVKPKPTPSEERINRELFKEIRLFYASNCYKDVDMLSAAQNADAQNQ